MLNGYNFTERVRKVLMLAREEAARLHHEYVGTEHILLGLLQEGEGIASVVLQNLSVDLVVTERLRVAIQPQIPQPCCNIQGGAPRFGYTARTLCADASAACGSTQSR